MCKKLLCNVAHVDVVVSSAVASSHVLPLCDYTHASLKWSQIMALHRKTSTGGPPMSALKNITRSFLVQLAPLATQTVQNNVNVVPSGSTVYNLETLQSCALLISQHQNSTTQRPKQTTALNVERLAFASMPTNVALTSRSAYKLCIL